MHGWVASVVFARGEQSPTSEESHTFSQHKTKPNYQASLEGPDSVLSLRAKMQLALGGWVIGVGR